MSCIDNNKKLIECFDKGSASLTSCFSINQIIDLEKNCINNSRINVENYDLAYSKSRSNRKFIEKKILLVQNLDNTLINRININKSKSIEMKKNSQRIKKKSIVLIEDEYKKKVFVEKMMKLEADKKNIYQLSFIQIFLLTLCPCSSKSKRKRKLCILECRSFINTWIFSK
jgi:GTP cyclohydrolase FolE2